MIVDGAVVIKVDKYGRPELKHSLVPGPESKNGRPTEYQVVTSFVTRHVLDYGSEYHHPSKHARGRIRPRTAAEQRRAVALQARFVRASKRLARLQQQTVPLAA
jgi:hypothetical protein